MTEQDKIMLQHAASGKFGSSECLIEETIKNVKKEARNKAESEILATVKDYSDLFDTSSALSLLRDIVEELEDKVKREIEEAQEDYDGVAEAARESLRGHLI